jgi:hypothetical protein
VSELVTLLHEAVASLAASDKALKRFGARAHRYRLEPPKYAAREWPDDLCEFVSTFASGGAGPYYGVQLGAVYDFGGMRALPVAHMGCGYAAVVALESGAVWIDASAIDVRAPMHASFTAYYLDWIDRLANNTLPEAFVPPGQCALALALGGYLGVHEQRLGLQPGMIGGQALKDALAQLKPGAIEITAQQSPLFADGTRVPPCIACARLLANLGLDESVVA